MLFSASNICPVKSGRSIMKLLSEGLVGVGEVVEGALSGPEGS